MSRRKTAAKPECPLVIAVCADPWKDRTLLRAAARVAVDLNLPFLAKPRVRGLEMLLVVAPNRLELRVVGGPTALRGGRAICVDLSRLDTKSPAGRRLKQPIARAVGLRRLKDLEQRRPIVIDATAGWGADAALLASLGCKVLAVERHPVVSTLLRDGILRAAAQRPDTFARLSLVNTDAQAMFRRMTRSSRARPDLPAVMAEFLQPDVVYIDPMFPPRKTTEVKPLRVLRRLVGSDEDAGRLFRLALGVARQRVVVKRPLRAERISDRVPTASHEGKSVRYDVYTGEATKGRRER